jgi:UDP-2,3-diacylglucosamine hydrolase
VADTFLSDVHLRHDRPERAGRLARAIGPLGSGDRLFLVGDLCDFWFASRQRRLPPMDCRGLRALVDFRVRGGVIVALAGNHDVWLGPFYRSLFEPEWHEDDLRVESHGLRIYLAHGHRLGARMPWKAVMEGRAFLRGFAALPEPLARGLERRLDRSNDVRREADNRRHIAAYRRRAHAMAGAVDLFVVGHIHRPTDEPGPPRMIVLGGWHHGASYLRVDDEGAAFRVEPG